MKKIQLILILVCLSNMLSAQSFGKEQYIKTAVNDFFRTKDVKKSDVFRIRFRTICLNNITLYSVIIIPEKSYCAFLLSNEDGVGKPYYTGIKYLEKSKKLFIWCEGTNIVLDEQTFTKLFEYNFIHRKANNFGTIGKLLTIFRIPLFCQVQRWYGLNQLCGKKYYTYSKKYSKYYDTYYLEE